MSDNARTLAHFAETVRSGANDLEELAYCMKAARRWASWIIAGEA